MHLSAFNNKSRTIELQTTVDKIYTMFKNRRTRNFYKIESIEVKWLLNSIFENV